MSRPAQSDVLFGVLLALWPVAALAHEADLVHARLFRESGAPSVSQTLTLTGATLELLAPVDADADRELSQSDLDARGEAIALGVWDAVPLHAGGKACQRSSSRAQLTESFVELSAVFACGPGELSQTFKILQLLPSNYRVVLTSSIDGAVEQRIAQGHSQTLVIPKPSFGSARVEGLAGWFGLGIFHIFTGFDHLAFLVALLLVCERWRRVLVLVTAFTLAHSITLGATALKLVGLTPAGSRWVEALIAASIIWVALENLLFSAPRHRAWVVFAFGLVHGFGFASVLRGYGLGEAVASGLLGFNLGVEVGQGCVVAVLFPVLGWVKRQPSASVWVVRAGSLVILAAGGYWLWERALG